MLAAVATPDSPRRAAFWRTRRSTRRRRGTERMRHENRCVGLDLCRLERNQVCEAETNAKFIGVGRNKVQVTHLPSDLPPLVGENTKTPQFSHTIMPPSMENHDTHHESKEGGKHVYAWGLRLTIPLRDLQNNTKHLQHTLSLSLSRHCNIHH